MSKVLDDAKAAAAAAADLVTEIEAQESEGDSTVNPTIDKITVTYSDGSSADFTAANTTAKGQEPLPGTESDTPIAGGTGTPVEIPPADGSATSSETASQSDSVEANTSSTGGAGADAGTTPTA